MAKKQQPKLSYGPNMGLIAGEAQLAASETALANVNQSFVTGAAAMFGAIQQANKERDAKMEAYETQVGGLPDINQFEDPKNKQIIKNFLNTQRDEYVRLADLYENTKDRDVKDKMEQIKFSLVNLNDQIKTFNQDKLDYRTANEENQLASLRTYQEKDGTDFFTNAFTNNAAFSIDEAGDMVFGINKNSYKYRDKAGKWNSKNNIDESNVLKMYGDVYKSGGKGDKFNADNVRRGLYNSFKNTGNSALQVFVTTDLTSDTSGLSFEEQFASGSLKEKHPEMYKGFTPDKDGNYNTDWMFENKNGDILRNKVSDYFTKVMEDGHGQGRTDNYKAPKIDNKNPALKNPERGGFLYGANSTGFDDSHPDENKRSRVLNIGFDQMVRNRNALLPKNVVKGSEVPGEHYVYKFNGDTWQAFYNGEKIKDVRGSQIASWEGLLSPLDIQAGNGLPMFDIGTATYKKDKQDEEKKSLEKPLTPGGIGLTSINSSSVNDIEKSIQSIFIPQFATDFNISPVYKTTLSLEQKGNIQRIVKNKIKITGPGGFEEIYNVGPDSTAEIADQITNDILEVSDYRKQVDPDLLVN
tara:strand:+ start:1327 stop:3072 length:1746 start_codon:yes stop_codon:yes gene_type:complete